jgi:hypothetical protein
MKIPPPNRERGVVAVVIMLATLSLLVVLVNANSRNALNLQRELQRLDEQQAARWTQVPPSRPSPP